MQFDATKLQELFWVIPKTNSEYPLGIIRHLIHAHLLQVSIDLSLSCI